MKIFIELTLRNTNTRILVAVDSIINVFEDSSTFIEIKQDRLGRAVGIFVKESYDEVINALVHAGSSISKI